MIHTGKDGGSACALRDVLFQTNFPSKTRSTFVAFSHLRLIILMSLFPSRVCLPLAAGKVMITFINVSFVSTILAKNFRDRRQNVLDSEHFYFTRPEAVTITLFTLSFSFADPPSPLTMLLATGILWSRHNSTA